MSSVSLTATGHDLTVNEQDTGRKVTQFFLNFLDDSLNSHRANVTAENVLQVVDKD